MSLFGVLITCFVLILIIFDRVLLPKSSRAALKWMSSLYIFVIFFIWMQRPFIKLSELLEVGRPVDLLVYISILILMREFFLSRQKAHIQNKQLTALAREIALSSVRKKSL